MAKLRKQDILQCMPKKSMSKQEAQRYIQRELSKRKGRSVTRAELLSALR